MLGFALAMFFSCSSEDMKEGGNAKPITTIDDFLSNSMEIHNTLINYYNHKNGTGDKVIWICNKNKQGEYISHLYHQDLVKKMPSEPKSAVEYIKLSTIPKGMSAH